MRVLITGSCGLVGSEAVGFYAGKRHDVLGIDNNSRKYFFGSHGDTSGMRAQISAQYPTYRHEAIDIRDRAEVLVLIREFQPEFIVHTAAQPSHDWAQREPFTDFEVNAVGTLNLLEAVRLGSPNCAFAFLSTNKVYGDSPNTLPIEETATRFEYTGQLRGKGIDESQSIDNNLHSLFGASKLSADILVQEYGKYFGLKTAAFRGGCLTGSKHAGVELHGFLSYIVDCAIRHRSYTIFGYKGKQVRDQLHSIDVVQALELFRQSPKCGEAYNLGGGFTNSASILEIIYSLKQDFDLELPVNYNKEARKGDHICYYTNMSKFKSHYPSFNIEKNLKSILREMVENATYKLKAA